MTYVNYDSLTALGVILPVLGLIIFALRTYGRITLDKNIGIDDVLLVVAGVLNIACGVALTYFAQTHVIGGDNEETIEQVLYSVQDFESTLEKFEWAYYSGHILAIGFIKLSLLFFFRRLFSIRGCRTPFDYANWILIISTIAWTVVTLLLNIFSCGLTFSDNWSSLSSLQTSCLSSFDLLIATAVSDWVLDLALFIEPAVMVGSLQLSLRSKLPAFLLFGTSILAVTAGVLRMIVFVQVSTFDFDQPTINLIGTTLDSGDFKGVVSITLFWTYMEIGVGFIVACLPPCVRVLDTLILKPVLRKWSSFSSASTNQPSSTYLGRHGLDISGANGNQGLKKVPNVSVV